MAAVFAAGFLIVLALVPAILIMASKENAEPPVIVIRVDDIQDYAFREAQLFILDESINNQVPLSLAVIAGAFGEDTEIVQKTKLAVSLGSDVSVHGWKHEDLAELSMEEQSALLFQSKRRIREVLDFDTGVLVPPMYSINEDTIAAMHREGYNVFSTHTDVSGKDTDSKIMSLPGTVELSRYSNQSWEMKSPDSVREEVMESISRHGFAVIVTHPQEFISNGRLDPANMETYRDLLKMLKETCTFSTLQELSEKRAA